MMEDNYQEDYLSYVGWVFEQETLWVALSFLGFFLALGLFVKLSDSLGEMNFSSLFKRKGPPRNKSLLKREKKKKLEYNRK